MVVATNRAGNSVFHISRLYEVWIPQWEVISRRNLDCERDLQSRPRQELERHGTTCSHRHKERLVIWMTNHDAIVSVWFRHSSQKSYAFVVFPVIRWAWPYLMLTSQEIKETQISTNKRYRWDPCISHRKLSQNVKLVIRVIWAFVVMLMEVGYSVTDESFYVSV